LIGAGFPNQFFNDSWVVGFGGADHGWQDAGLEGRAWTLAQAVLATELLVQADKLVGGSDAVLVIDDTAIPKKGTHSVGVAAQYASALGKTANCQTLVSLTLARGVARLDEQNRFATLSATTGPMLRSNAAHGPKIYSITSSARC
jgi:hypothetical protein